jgi:hypothetical protein
MSSTNTSDSKTSSAYLQRAAPITAAIIKAVPCLLTDIARIAAEYSLPCLLHAWDPAGASTHTYLPGHFTGMEGTGLPALTSVEQLLPECTRPERQTWTAQHNGGWVWLFGDRPLSSRNE